MATARPTGSSWACCGLSPTRSSSARGPCAPRVDAPGRPRRVDPGARGRHTPQSAARPWARNAADRARPDADRRPRPAPPGARAARRARRSWSAPRVRLRDFGAQGCPAKSAFARRTRARRSIDLAPVLAELGGRVALFEGGPRLFGAFLAQGLIDELFLTLAPQLVGRPMECRVVWPSSKASSSGRRCQHGPSCGPSGWPAATCCCATG